MYIMRWLKGHPLISIWVLGVIAILLSTFGGSHSEKAALEGHETKATLSENNEETEKGNISHKSVSEVFEEDRLGANTDDSLSKTDAEKDNGKSETKVVAKQDDSLSSSEAVPEQIKSNDASVKETQTEESLAKNESKEPLTDEAQMSNSSSKQVEGAVDDLNASNIEDMLLMAREAYWNNGLDEAAEIYSQLIKLEPDVLDHKGELGNVYWRQGYPKKAAELYSEIAIPMIRDGKTEPVANMLGFIGLFYPDRAAQINDHLQSETNSNK